jgi:hypothetical protein
MSRVFSMDSEGIWKACTAKVMTNRAMTTVTAMDCAAPSTALPRDEAAGAAGATSCWGWVAGAYSTVSLTALWLPGRAGARLAAYG